MLDLSTTYLGLELPHPLIVGASPLSDTVDGVRRLEDCEAAAICLRSLFEEQIVAESLAAHRATDFHADSYGEALSYLPAPEEYRLGPDAYLELIRDARAAVRVPIIASLNGTSLGRWLEYARLIEQAGASALELNVFHVPTRPDISASQIESRLVEIVREVRGSVKIPLAVKLGPFYTALAHLARELVAAGADGLVLFNRYFEPDVDVERLDHAAHLQLSTSGELLLRVRWLAILSAQVRASLAVTGGVHTVQDVIKSVMSGAHAVQLVSALLRCGPIRVSALLQELADWLGEYDYQSVRQMQGSMNMARCPDPAALARGNYIHMLQTWRAG